MAPEKVTEMVLNVDLKCPGCYKKVKKVICKIPQIRDQVFDVEKNKVKIMVVCCSPEKIREKLCYKGNGAIQSIEIIEKPKPAADKPKEPEKAKPAAADKPKEPVKAKPAAAEKPKEPAEKAKPAADKPKEAAKPKEPEKPKANDKPKEAADKPKDAGKPPEKPKDAEKPKEGGDKPAAAAPPKKPDAGPNPDVAKMVYEPVHGYPQMYPSMIGYGQYYDQGYGGPQYQHGYGMPLLTPPPSYGGFGAYEQGYNDNRSHHSSNHYGGEEDGEGCSIM